MCKDKEDLNEQTSILVSRARGGNKDAMGALFKLYEKRLIKAVHKNLGAKLHAKMESADLVQSVWKDCLSNMEGFEYRGPDSFFRWLSLRILRKIQDKARYFAAEKRNADKEERIQQSALGNEAVPKDAACDPTPSHVAMANENLDRLLRLLDRLPDQQRQVLVFHLKDNKSFEEIAESLGKTPGAIRQLYNRALKRINDLINKEKP